MSKYEVHIVRDDILLIGYLFYLNEVAELFVIIRKDIYKSV